MQWNLRFGPFSMAIARHHHNAFGQWRLLHINVLSRFSQSTWCTVCMYADLYDCLPIGWLYVCIYIYIYMYHLPPIIYIGEPETTIDMCLCEKRVQRWYDINMTMHDFVAYIYIWIAHCVLWLLASAKFLLISIFRVSWVLSFPNVSMKIPTILS